MGGEVDRDSRAVDELAVDRSEERPTPCGNDAGTLLQQPRQHPTLPATERWFSLFSKQCGDAAPPPDLKHGIEVQEPPADSPGQGTADAGLATTHHPDKNNMGSRVRHENRGHGSQRNMGLRFRTITVVMGTADQVGNQRDACPDMKIRLFIGILSLVIVLLLALVAYSLLGDLSPPDRAIEQEIPYPNTADAN